MKFEQLGQHIKNKQLSPCYLLHGDDDFLILKAKQKLLDLVQMPDFNSLDMGENVAVHDLIASAEVLPMISEYRIIFASFKSALDENFAKYLSNPNRQTLIVLTAAPADKSVGKAIPNIQQIDCNRLDNRSITAFILDKAKKNSANIDDDAINLLIEYCNRFLWRINTELDKLISFVSKSGNPISVTDIKNLVNPDLEYKAFELTDLIMSKRADRALTVLNDMLGEGPKTFGQLYGHFRRLLLVSISPKEQDLAAKLGVKDFAVSIAKRQAQGYTQLQLKEFVDKLHEVDLAIKSGKMTDKTALTSFITSVIGIQKA
ncbi:MAG: DNA polymerase III subunit delta [Firmicutes bacterium]|nr:DNA polymerase III subunit delta [Bacillota bacterium]